MEDDGELPVNAFITKSALYKVGIFTIIAQTAIKIKNKTTILMGLNRIMKSEELS